MTRLFVYVEGHTEESFVKEIVAPYLYDCGFSLVRPRLIGSARQRNRRGGIRHWNQVRRDIVHHLREDQGCVITTMVDYYGLPRKGFGAWPGREKADMLAFPEKVLMVEGALSEDICNEMGRDFDRSRFIPYVMMHEFEALLFSDCERFATSIDRPDITLSLQKIRNGFPNPEQIDDSPDTAPSKRISALIPEYQKPLHGLLATLEIGLQKICAECPHFAKWLSCLQELR